jgi:hypothetical protein
MKGRLRAPSPAFVVSLIALFVALGGTTYAATGGDTKVDTKLVKKLAPSLSVKQAQTANSATNAVNATHATSADISISATNANNAANASALGGVAATGYQRSTLPSGQTEHGVFSAFGQGAAAGGYFSNSVTFPVPLTADLPQANVVFVPSGTLSATHCPGAGQADPGYLCVYEAASSNRTGAANIFNPITALNGASKFGFGLFFAFAAAGGAFSYGEWAVTA